MHKIVKVEPINYTVGPGEALIGFNFHYDDGMIYNLGPVFTQAEYQAVLDSAKPDSE